MADFTVEIVETNAALIVADALDRQLIIDDFEHNNAGTYYDTVPSTGSWNTTTNSQRPNGTGNYGIDLNGQRTIWSRPGDGLENYPSPGTTINYYFRPVGTGGTSQMWFLFGGTTNRDADRYQVEVINNTGTFRIRKDVYGSSRTVISPHGSFSSLSTSAWYRIEVVWETNGSMTASLYRDGSDSAITSVSASDTTFSSTGRIGYRTSTDARMYVDDVGLAT